jgi:putative transposase
MSKQLYPSDLSDSEWSTLEPLLPPQSKVGHPSLWPRRHILNSIFYVLRTGCAWRYLPNDFPPWQTVYYHLYRWRRRGAWEAIHAVLRRRARIAVGRDPEPNGAIMDSQSVKTTEQGGPRGFDGAKKLSGRKRHVLVDTAGLLLKVVVHPANIPDRQGGRLLLDRIRQQLPYLNHIWADQGYTGEFKQWTEKD